MHLRGLGMALTRYKLGDLIELCEAKNETLQYSLEDVKGISIQKIFIETKADMTNVSLKPYYLVQPDDFAYVTVTSRNGEKITLAHNTTDKTYIVSSSYVVFRVKDKEHLLSDFLFMYFNRPEFDRYSRFNSWGSARETFDWADMCDIDIDLPPLEIQQKYVDVYNASIERAKNNIEKGRLIENIAFNYLNNSAKYIDIIDVSDRCLGYDFQCIEKATKSTIYVEVKSFSIDKGYFEITENEYHTWQNNKDRYVFFLLDTNQKPLWIEGRKIEERMIITPSSYKCKLK